MLQYTRAIEYSNEYRALDALPFILSVSIDSIIVNALSGLTHIKDSAEANASFVSLLVQ